MTIHKHLGTPARVVCCGPLHSVKSPETPEKARTVRAPCDNTPQGGDVKQAGAAGVGVRGYLAGGMGWFLQLTLRWTLNPAKECGISIHMVA